MTGVLSTRQSTLGTNAGERLLGLLEKPEGDFILLKGHGRPA